MNLKFVERFLLIMAFVMIGVSFIFAFEGLQYASDYVAVWGALFALLSGIVNHKRIIVDLKKELKKSD